LHGLIPANKPRCEARIQPVIDHREPSRRRLSHAESLLPPPQELYNFLHFPFLFKKRAAMEQAIKLNSQQLTLLQETMLEQAHERDNDTYAEFVQDLVQKVTPACGMSVSAGIPLRYIPLGFPVERQAPDQVSRVWCRDACMSLCIEAPKMNIRCSIQAAA